MVYNVLHILEATKNMNPDLTAHDAYKLVLAGLSDAELREFRHGLMEMGAEVENRLQARQTMREAFRRVNS